MRKMRWMMVPGLISIGFSVLLSGCYPTLIAIPSESGGNDGGAGALETGSASSGDGIDSVVTDTESIPDGGNHCLEPDETDSSTILGLDTEGDPWGSGTQTGPGETTDTVEVPTENRGSDSQEGNRATDTRVETSVGTDTDTNTMISDTNTGSEFQQSTGTDTATGSEEDSVTQMDSATVTDTGEPPELSCADDMVLIPADPDQGNPGSFCMDRYEASRKDASAASAGSDDTIATSRPGVIPWFVNPMNSDALSVFQSACVAAGKRLCSREEWGYGCSGPEGLDYSFGNDFNAEICNSVDTYCDDYCLSEGIPAEECYTEENCGYQCGLPGSGVSCFHVDPTGAHGGCTDAFGAFDVNGNVWEVVPSSGDSRGYEVRGGAFNCAYPDSRFACGYNAGWTSLYAGFRCCKEPDAS